MLNTVDAPRTFTFILAGGKGERLYPLTQGRAKPAIPMGAAHRLIDFTLSNCLNSGLRQVHVLTQYHHESLHQYLDEFHEPSRFGADPEALALSLCPPLTQPYKGTADAVFQNLDALRGAEPDLVLILSGDHLYKMDYRDLIKEHLKNGAELTVAATEYPCNAASQFGVLEIDANSKLLGFEEKPASPATLPGRPSHCLVSMGVYLFNASILMDLLSQDAEGSTTHDFGRDILPRMVGSSKSFVYNFTDKGKKLGTYWRDVGTVDSFFRSNMDLLPSAVFKSSNGGGWPLVDRRRLRTVTPDARQDSVVAEGVLIESSATVNRSVLSNGVEIHHRSHVEDSILMANVHVGTDVRIRRAILDENVHVPNGMDIGYDVQRDRQYGHLSEDGIIVIPSSAQLKNFERRKFPTPIERIVVAGGVHLEAFALKSSRHKRRGTLSA